MIKSLILTSFAMIACQGAEPAPRELGAVRWGSRLEPALQASKQSGKPVLLLFQEVPG